jgi:DNA end-binding protein Ku
MAPRSTWKGYLKLSLISIPLKAYTATSGGGSPISLNQLHEECKSRIRYQKTCPIHGEVPHDEIVSGYEFAKGQYVIIDPDELDKLRSENDKSISVDTFVPADAIDPVYHSGKTYYLVPDGPIGQKPYALLHQTMADSNLHAIAQVVLSKREQLVLLRPIEKLLGMTVLEYHAQVKQPAAFEDELTQTTSTEDELQLARTLIEGMASDEVDLSRYRDTYVDKLTALIEAKVEGKELVSPPAEETPQVINLMDALKASVQQIKAPTKKAVAQTKPARKMAASTREPKKAAAPKRKKKTG